MIRPSALTIAQHCGLAPALGEKYPEQSDAAESGIADHAEIAACILGDTTPKGANARAAVGYIRGRIEGGARVTGIEVPARLEDPESGDLVTEGTADVVLEQAGVLEVLDWKTGRMENVPPPAENLQLAAYALAVALARGAESYRTTLVFLRDGNLTEVQGPIVDGAEMWAALDRVRKAASRPPVASPGPHCGGCYQRALCPSWRERATTALSLVGRADLTVTDETATEMILRVQAVREAADLAEEMVRAHVRNGGSVEADGKVYGPQMVNGRRSGPTVKELEQAGLAHLIREGKPSERWGWKNAR